ncbi:uncharacterized protein STEHIDRAFT_36371, partial [Stereum hirsutum FP-91666 SS1]|uniref:uncharacterized protein n=1 Tax=Stereum hirsutum (strain FP-91666) TaxID=721885 RepID=UPI0004449229
MECANCELRQRQLYCENCINSHIRDVRLQITRVASDRDDHVHKASSSSESVAPNRLRRADLATGSERLEDVKEALARLRRENDKSRARLRSLRESLATRRRTLSQARLLSLTSTSSATHQSNPTSPSSTPVPSNTVLDAQISRELQQLSLLSDTLARARSGLVSELVEVFNIVEVGGRPPIGRKAGIKGEWTIEGLVLPVPGDIRRYPPDHVNAVITHTIHFLGLLTFYLGIKLPFETSWSGKKLGVGQPWIRSIKGTENGSWAKWTSKHCLHVSTTSPATPRPSTPPPTNLSTPPPPSTSTSTSTSPPSSTTSPTHPFNAAAAAASSSTSAHGSFTTAYTMLLYDVAYLAWTQGVDVGLSQAGEVLANLVRVCGAGDVGRRSHATFSRPPLGQPTPPSFPLDFAQLLQVQA